MVHVHLTSASLGGLRAGGEGGGVEAVVNQHFKQHRAATEKQFSTSSRIDKSLISKVKFTVKCSCLIDQRVI